MFKTSAQKLVVVGQGYVGLPLAVLASQIGYSVVGIDTDEVRISDIRRSLSPVSDVSNLALQIAQQSSKYFPTADYSNAEGFDIAVITVPTPLSNRKPDLTHIKSAGRSIGNWIRPGCLIVLESTTYPGTTEELLVPILESESGLVAGKDFFVGYSPERIDPGNQIWSIVNTPKIVSGVNASSLKAVSAFYSSLGIPLVSVSGTREAELVKLLENTFRHVNIALVNELAMFSESLGVNILEAVEAAATKPFGFMKFLPGPGVGGHCLPVDPSYLSWAIELKSGSSFKFVELANSINDGMPDYVVNQVENLLNRRSIDIQGSRIVLLGLAYKSDTRDLRESPALSIGQTLREKGARVFASDNWVLDSNWPEGFTKVAESGADRFDMGVLITNHSGDAYGEILNKIDLILDTRNCIAGDNVVQLWGVAEV